MKLKATQQTHLLLFNAIYRSTQLHSPSLARVETKVCQPGSKWTEDEGVWECKCDPDGKKAICYSQSNDYESKQFWSVIHQNIATGETSQAITS